MNAETGTFLLPGMVVIRNLKGSVDQLHYSLRHLNASEVSIVIDGSCRIDHHGGDIVESEPVIRLEQLVVNSDMSLQSLQALLAPLAVHKVILQQCRILDEGKENNEFTGKGKMTLIRPNTYKVKCGRHSSYIYMTCTPEQGCLPQERNVYRRVKISQALSLQVVISLIDQQEGTITDSPNGMVDNFILDEVEMNPEGLRQLYRHVKTQDTSVSCMIEVTIDGGSMIEMVYRSTSALSCVTAVGIPSPRVSACNLFQGTNDHMAQASVSLMNQGLDEVPWLTSDVHSLMTSLRLTHLHSLGVGPACTLRHSPLSASSTPWITVGYTKIVGSLSINTLVGLLSHKHLEHLLFADGCEVLDMPSYLPPPNQESVSVVYLILENVSWRTSDVHSLLTSLRLRHLLLLRVMSSCMLRPSPSPGSSTSRTQVNVILIEASLFINTLVDLLSNIDLNKVGFSEDCTVQGISSYSLHPRQEIIIKELMLGKIQWCVSELMDVIKGLQVTHLEKLVLLFECQLKDSTLPEDKHPCRVNRMVWERAPIDILVMRSLLEYFPTDSVEPRQCKIIHCESEKITINNPPAEMILCEIKNPQSLRQLYIPGTSKVNVTWLDKKRALSKKELAAIFPDAEFSGDEVTRSSLCILL